MAKWILIAVVAVAAIFVMWGVSAYNGLVASNQEVQAAWSQVENVYQRRADLVPNLVETVKGAANFEKETLQQVIEARAKATQSTTHVTIDNPEAFQQFQNAQAQLSSSLARLMAVAESYPQLTATQNFRDLQAQLEGTENRIAVERMRFNEAAQRYNTKKNTFPTAIVAGFFGSKFPDRPYFKAQEGAEKPPAVKF
ncbi:MAG: LemA family protein [Myxococcaceae bacterium]|nr:LemA family protein [Myxococcaceae bacterium]